MTTPPRPMDAAKPRRVVCDEPVPESDPNWRAGVMLAVREYGRVCDRHGPESAAARYEERSIEQALRRPKLYSEGLY